MKENLSLKEKTIMSEFNTNKALPEDNFEVYLLNKNKRLTFK